MMKERIIEFLKAENKSSAQLAEEIGVQPSGISHIISGRNKPSLDFILKMLDRYKYLSTEWILFGKGAMYKEKQAQTLFDAYPEPVDSMNNEDLSPLKTRQAVEDHHNNSEQDSGITVSESLKRGTEVVRIVWFYSNNSFEEYFPAK